MQRFTALRYLQAFDVISHNSDNPFGGGGGAVSYSLSEKSLLTIMNYKCMQPYPTILCCKAFYVNYEKLDKDGEK